MSTLNEYDAGGVAAIIYLQFIAGKQETRARAISMWFRMEPWEREQTLLANQACRAAQQRGKKIVVQRRK